MHNIVRNMNLLLGLLVYLLNLQIGVAEQRDVVRIENLRKLLEPVIPKTSLVHNLTRDDVYLMKWLKSNGMDVSATANKLIEHVRWREAGKLDDIDSYTDWSYFQSEYTIITGHEDKRGQPIAEMWLSEWNVRKVIVAGLRKELSNWVRRMVELQQRQLYEARRQGRNVTHATLLMDFEGFNLVTNGCNGCIQLFSFWAQDWETQYPELYDQIIMVNASPVVQLLRAAMRTVLGIGTMNKVQSYSDKRVWKAKLDSIIDRNERSVRFGGNLRL